MTRAVPLARAALSFSVQGELCKLSDFMVSPPVCAGKLEVAGMESFDWAIWRFVWSDAKAGIWDKWRVIKEAAVSVSVGVAIFPLFGSADSANDFTVEKLLVVPATLVAMMLVHALWSWVTGPRRLFYQQSEIILDLEISNVLAKAAAGNERLALVRSHFQSLIHKADEASDQHDMAACMVEAEELVRGMVPSFTDKLFRSWPQQHPLSPEPTIQDEMGFGKVVASLKIIMATITINDLPAPRT
jgi:hypothetical protein